MTLAFSLLVALLLAAPGFLVSDTLLLHGCLTAYVALLVLIAAASIRPGEAAFLSGVINPFAKGASALAILFFVQLVPVPISEWRHPIWISAETALGQPVWGSITISPGDTLIAFTRYLTACGLFFVAVAVSIDRRRAETLLVTLWMLATALALVLAVHNIGGFVFLGQIESTGRRSAIAAAASVGAILSFGMLLFAFERFETRHGRAEFSRLGFGATIFGAMLALAIDFLTVILFTSKPQIVATLTGLGFFALLTGFRRAGIGAKFSFLIALAAIAVPIAAIGQDLLGSRPDLSLRFAVDAPRMLIDAAQRMIGDTGLAGSGAGTFSDLFPLYGDVATPSHAPTAPTAAAASVIGFGWSVTWLIVASAALGFAWLTRGSLERGRDSFFTAAAAACLLTVMLEAFFDASLFHSTSLILVMAILGLGVSQSISRTAH